MKNEIKNSKRRIGLTSAIASAMLLCLGIVGFASYGRINTGKTDSAKTLPEPVVGAEISESSVTGRNMRLSVTKLKTSEYASYGVSPQTESAYTLTATVTPADASNKKLDWTLTFANASSSWSTGKTVTDYVTLTPASDGALTAVVENKAAFGEPIIVKAESRDNRSAYATCTVQYMQRITGYSFSLDGKTFTAASATTASMTPDLSATKSPSASIATQKSTVYTKPTAESAEYYTIKPTSAFKTAITNAGLSAASIKEYSGTKSGTVANLFDSEWGKALYGTSASNRNKLISAVQGFSGSAYEIKLYTKQGGTQLTTFYITLDASRLLTQKAVESVSVSETELVF